MDNVQVVCEIKSYLDTQRFGVTSKTISKRVGISQKLSRYLVRTYLSDYIIKGRHCSHKLIKMI